jgi:serine phosphatase RsbU (regulator of sigma subunit)
MDMAVEFDASRLQLPRFRLPTAGDLCVPTAALPSDTTNFAVLELFNAQRELHSVPVVQDGVPVGLISRNNFMSRMSKPFHHELYGKKNCTVFMDAAPLIVDASLAMEELTFRAVAFGEKALADGFIITRAGAPVGVGYGLALMNAVAKMQSEKNRQIMHSIDYASVIQRSMLRASREALAASLPDAWLAWQPRDVVGGDFYHFTAYADGWFAAIADCTGHGVPGAFMTLIASSVLSQGLQRLGPRDPAALLGEVNTGVKAMLGQQSMTERGDRSAESNDGLDAAFVWFDSASRRITFAGARVALLTLAEGDDDVTTIDGERMGAGYLDTPTGFTWNNREATLAPGALLLLSTDGLTDQIGGPKDIAYGKRRIRAQLLANRNAPCPDLAKALLADYAAWQGEQPRRDDLTFFCCRP